MGAVFKSIFSKRNAIVVGLCTGTIVVILMAGIFIVIILFGLVPYQTPAIAFLFVAGYTAVTAGGVWLVLALLALFKKGSWLEERFFSTSFFCLLMTSKGNSLFAYLTTDTAISHIPADIPYFDIWILFTLFTGIMGVAPIWLLRFWLKTRHLAPSLQKEEKQAFTSSAQVQLHAPPSIPDPGTIILHGSSKKSLTVLPQDIVMIESQGNYLYFSYNLNGKIVQKTLRSTLSKVEKTLSRYTFLVRCHRAFIVNIYRMEKISSTKLELKGIEMEVPISKSRKSFLQKQLEAVGYS